MPLTGHMQRRASRRFFARGGELRRMVIARERPDDARGRLVGGEAVLPREPFGFTRAFRIALVRVVVAAFGGVSAGRSDLLQVEPEAVRAAEPVEREHRVALEGIGVAIGVLRHELIEVEVPRVVYLIGLGARFHRIADLSHGLLEKDAVAVLGR